MGEQDMHLQEFQTVIVASEKMASLGGNMVSIRGTNFGLPEMWNNPAERFAYVGEGIITVVGNPGSNKYRLEQKVMERLRHSVVPWPNICFGCMTIRVSI